MKIAIIGSTSSVGKNIYDELDTLGYDVTGFSRNKSEECNQIDASKLDIELIKKTYREKYDFYIFSLGVLIPKNILEQSESEILDSLKINALYIIKSIEYIFSTNNKAKVLIIGSESGRKGSFDTSYFLAKSVLRNYVRQRGVSENQQLLLISPSTIEDSNMTQSRQDHKVLDNYRSSHPKKRFLFMRELVNVIVNLVVNPLDYLTNTEIEINGGKFCRMK